MSGADRTSREYRRIVRQQSMAKPNCSTWNNSGRMETRLARHVASYFVLFDIQLRKIMAFCALLQRMGIFRDVREKSHRSFEGYARDFLRALDEFWGAFALPTFQKLGKPGVVPFVWPPAKSGGTVRTVADEALPVSALGKIDGYVSVSRE